MYCIIATYEFDESYVHVATFDEREDAINYVEDNVANIVRTGMFTQDIVYKKSSVLADFKNAQVVPYTLPHNPK